MEPTVRSEGEPCPASNGRSDQHGRRGQYGQYGQPRPQGQPGFQGSYESHGPHETRGAYGSHAPLRRSAVYNGEPDTIAAARHFVADFVAQASARNGVPISGRLTGATQLIVSELVTNACKYAPGPCLVDLELNADVLEIAVWDTEYALPVPRAPEPSRIGQHGVEIVMALCESFDVRREPVGKRIMVRVALADAAG